MDLPNSQNELDARFQFLLQPIKDLAKNFDVDLVSSLGDYLTEIAQLTIHFNDGVTSVNFAEAALVVQGSTSVYSQKVEYLYRLTFTVLDLLGNKRQQQQQAQSSTAAEKSQNLENEQLVSMNDLVEGNNTQITNNNQDNSNTKDIAPVTPTVLLRPDNTNATETMLISRNGEVLGRMSDFRMSTSSLHPTGALLFDHSHLPQLCSVQSDPGESAPTFLHNQTVPPSEDPAVDEGCPPDLGNDSGDFEATGGDDQQVTVIQNDVNAADRDVRRAPLRRKETREPTAEDIRDIWSLLDEHQASSKSSEKNFRKGKVFTIANRVTTESNRKRKRRSEPDAAAVPMIPFCQLWNNNYFSRGLKKPAFVHKACAFPDFEGLMWKQAEKLKQLRVQRRKRDNVVANEEREDESDTPLIQDENGDDVAYGGVGGGDEDDDGGPAFEIPDVPLEELLGTARQNNDLGSDISDAATGLSYEELVHRYVEGFMESARQYIQDTALAQRVLEWEKKIVPRLQDEERRRPFDIHGYGTEIIEKVDFLGGSVCPVKFAKLVEEKQRFEVCRYLLATLQLANFGNIEIGCPTDNRLEMDNATCKILSRRRHFEELNECRISSLE